MTPASKKTIPLYQAGMPSTMVSSRPAMTLNPTEFADLTNVRNRYGVIEARKSDEAWATTGLPADPVFYGAWAGDWEGQEYVIVAVKNGDQVDLYDSSDGVAYTKRTAGPAGATGCFPDTQLSDFYVQKNGIQFQPFNDKFQSDGVLISDGNSVLLWRPTYATYHIRKVSQFTNADGMAKDSTINGAPESFLYKGDSSSEISLLGAIGVSMQADFPVDGPLTVTIAPPFTHSDGFELIFATPKNIRLGQQFFILNTTPLDNVDIFRVCKVEVKIGSTYHVLNDPESAYLNEPTVETYFDDTVAKTLHLFTWTNVDPTLQGSITSLRVTYPMANDQYETNKLEILAIGLGGTGVSRIPNYGISYYSSWLGTESPFVVLDSNKAKGVRLRFLNDTGDKFLNFPISDVLRMNWTVRPLPEVEPSIYDFLNLYRKDSGSSSYLFVGNTSLSDWTGISGTPSNSWVSINPGVIVDDKDETGLNSERSAPGSTNTVPTGFTCSAYANNRIFLGHKGDYSFSEYRHVMRFASLIDINSFERSPGSFEFVDESPKAFFYLSGDANLDRLALITNKATYAISGLDTYSLMRPAKISQFGTLSPASFGSRREFTFFLDDTRHFRIIPGGNELDGQSLAVKNILEGISTSNVSKVVGTVYDDRFYLFYTPSGQASNNSAFVFDMLSSTLTRDTLEYGVVATVVFDSKFLAFMSNHTVRRLEVGNANVNIALQSREIGTDGESWQAGRQRVYCDDTNSTVTMSWTSFRNGATLTDSIDTNADGTDVRTDRLTSLGKSVRGRSIQFGLTGAIPGGTKLYHWSVEQEDRISEGKA